MEERNSFWEEYRFMSAYVGFHLFLASTLPFFIDPVVPNSYGANNKSKNYQNGFYSPKQETIILHMDTLSRKYIGTPIFDDALNEKLPHYRRNTESDLKNPRPEQGGLEKAIE